MNPATVEAPAPRATPRAWQTWNENLHLYLGLYFLVFLWLFAASGLLLNHGWRFAEFWPQRKESTREQRITIPNAPTDLARAEDLMRQLGLAGELEWTTARPATDRFEFRVARPGRTVDVKVDLAQSTARVQEISVNGWGVLRTLHTFTGVRANAPGTQRDWSLTKLWSFAMDAVAVGLVALVLTSLPMAFARRAKRRGAAVALALGFAACGFFVFALRWL